MGRPNRSGIKPIGVFARLEPNEMEAFKQIAAAQRRSLGNLAAAVLAEYLKAQNKPLNGHEHKLPRVRANPTL